VIVFVSSATWRGRGGLIFVRELGGLYGREMLATLLLKLPGPGCSGFTVVRGN
jgi:hypothetical protein